MSSDAAPVLVVEDGKGPYGQMITSGPHALAADEPAALGGGDRAPSPHQLLMAALGACTNITLRMYAERHGWPLEKVSCEVSNARIEGAAAGAPNERFARRISLTGPLDDTQRARLLAIAGRCPVSQILARGAIVEADLG